MRSAGADVVGMSTIPEVLAAREEGLNVLVLSLVTNLVVIPDKYRSIKEEVAAEVWIASPTGIVYADSDHLAAGWSASRGTGVACCVA